MLIKFSIICILTLFVSTEALRKWIQPDAWGRAEQANDDVIHSGNCPQCSCDSNDLMKIPLPNSDNISAIYYKKLLSFIFNRKNLMYDEAGGFYSTNFILHISAKQLNQLEESADPRDWDGILSKVLNNVETIPRCKSKGFSSFWNFSLPSFSLSTEVHFTLIALAAILTIILLSKLYKFPWFLMSITGMFLFGFFYTYYECNRNLEIEEMVNSIAVDEDKCNFSNDGGSWSIWNYFSKKPSKEQCIEQLKKANKIQLRFCRPDVVFLMYINEVFLNQFKLIVERSTDIFRHSLERIPFPYNIVAISIFGLLLPTFLTLAVKYIINPSVWFRTTTNKRETTNQPISAGPSEFSADRISGENLTLLLQNFATKVDIEKKLVESMETISGVEVLESLPPADKSVGTADLELEESGNKANELTYNELEDKKKM